MKQYLKISIFSFLGILLAGTLIFYFLQPKPEQPTDSETVLTILDSQQNVILQADDVSDIYEKEYWAYLELVLAEAFNDLALTAPPNTFTFEPLFCGGYTLYTNFDAQAFYALQKAGHVASVNTASAITDLQGNLLAVYSANPEGESTNYASKTFAPYSALSPLSVYTPALEAGKIHWTSFYEDTPCEQIADNDGNLLDWPANLSGTYSGEKVTVYDATRNSLNTVAVKILTDVGFTESVKFLQDKLEMPLKEGDVSASAPLALGYLVEGITPVDMAGYYQIFASGGKYTPPKTVARIADSAGNIQYTRPSETRQVISALTADIMNRLLQGVTQTGGIGAKAKCGDIPVSGQIGEGTGSDHWFVGVSPGYSLAVWHGENSGNQAPEMFSVAMEALYDSKPNANRSCITHSNMQAVIYCTKSGMAIGPQCTTIEEGFFSQENTPDICHQCGGNESTEGGQ